MSGATIASIFGLSAVVLSIIGLSGVVPAWLWPVAAIVAGAAFLALAAIDAMWAHVFGFPQGMAARERTVFSTGLSANSIAGIAAVVLGILNLAYFGDIRFAAIAAIVLGIGLFAHSGVMRRLSNFTHDFIYRGSGNRSVGMLAANALSMAPLRDLLVGVAAAILGLLAMLGVVPTILTFIALLIVGMAATLTASTVCGAVLTTLQCGWARANGLES